MSLTTFEILKRRLAGVKAQLHVITTPDFHRMKVAICDLYGISLLDMDSKSRKPQLVEARKVFAHLAKKKYEEGATLVDIGHAIRRDHATVLYYIDSTEGRLSVDKKFKRLYEIIKQNVSCSTN